MKKTALARAAAAACALLSGLALVPSTALACEDCDCEDAPITATAAAPARHKLGLVRVQGAAPSSLPSNIPTTRESVTREDIERTINATDSEDALKYLPSLLVRKRYIGDYNHAILSSRASGTGNSARSAVYADGILLSNYLGNGVGGLSFPPRWGLVTPEEIERVDVMYGPFSAAYPGNSVGAVVDYQTRMPTKFEAHAKVGYGTQSSELYGHKASYRAWAASVSVGSREGGFSWWLNVNHTDSDGQPLTFATRMASTGTAVTTATPVTGALLVPNSSNAPWYLLGAGTQYNNTQDHLKLKLAYDLGPTVRANYVLGLWRNDSDGNSTSWLRDAAGKPVYSGAIVIDGRQFTRLTASDFALTREQLQHVMHGVSVKSHSGGEWDWEVAASLYGYQKDGKRQNGLSASGVLSDNPQPGAWTGGAGTLADGSGTGWNTLAAKGIWRPAGTAHVLDFGLQQDSYKLSYLSSGITGNYLADGPGKLLNKVTGKTRLQAAYAQDAWLLNADWKAVLGLRAEHWQARDGRTDFSATSSQAYAPRSENFLSPKAALSWQAAPETVIKLATGRAVRMPTVGELYGATSTTNSQYINDPGLKPEKSWTGELSVEQGWGPLQSRLTLFAETTRDSLYSQTVLDPVANKNISRVQNIDKVGTTGLEATLSAVDWGLKGLDLSGSVTYTDSRIKANAGFVTTPGDTVGKWQPNIPRWRATALAAYRLDKRWSASLAARYSGRQYRTLNNADVNGFAYMGVSRYATADLRLLWKLDRQWSTAFGIDNLNNARYWNFHNYPQRSYSAELKFDL
ncbi:TonB-dependent receptor [Roseateles saccharophilus]|uniref:Iron complex outermembrane receptor protein n=1 Tax=Roseateles saccharophilus TaxID=304 RepID=A0A4R3UHN6_ROSSA|nr:TonB-dependent receptor [Roseateles saccharophilus]MDG0835210.1 TonB-dependent receptor [Roseateles saccharophilus]TCU87142.1 iron complex outermembrane receptor protein [Roseateles saccharophilus]